MGSPLRPASRADKTPKVRPGSSGSSGLCFFVEARTSGHPSLALDTWVVPTPRLPPCQQPYIALKATYALISGRQPSRSTHSCAVWPLTPATAWVFLCNSLMPQGCGALFHVSRAPQRSLTFLCQLEGGLLSARNPQAGPRGKEKLFGRQESLGPILEPEDEGGEQG